MARTQHTKICPRCLGIFTTRVKDQGYCSNRCSGLAQARIPPDVRFWSKVDKSAGPDGCWRWTASCNAQGYGHFSIGYTGIRAHRFAWELTHGAIPDGLFVCHRCDNPTCVNPAHLFLGTNADNTADRHLKGRDAQGESSGPRRYPERLPRGEHNHLAKLTDAAVREIRSLLAQGVSGADLARRFGVTPKVITLVKQGRTWRHVA